MESSCARNIDTATEVFFDVPAETKPLFKKEILAQKLAEGLLPLNFYRKIKGRWYTYDFPADQMIIKIGKNEAESDIMIDEAPQADDIHVVLRRFREKWLVIERGSEELMRVNGIKRHQFLLTGNSSCVVQVGGALFVINNPAAEKEGTQSQPAASGDFYRIKSECGDLDYPSDKTLLLGSNPVCDIRVEGDEFAAVLSQFKSNYYFYSLSHEKFQADGDYSEEPAPLSNDGWLKIKNHRMIFQKPRQEAGRNNFSLGGIKSHPALLIIGNDGNPGIKYILPPAGTSILVGRDPDSYFAAPSQKISRKHAQILTYSNKILLTDMNTTNGTYVNGEKISKKITRMGDLIELADLKFILIYSE